MIVLHIRIEDQLQLFIVNNRIQQLFYRRLFISEDHGKDKRKEQFMPPLYIA